MIPAETVLLILLANGRIRDYRRYHNGFLIIRISDEGHCRDVIYVTNKPVANDFDFNSKQP